MYLMMMKNHVSVLSVIARVCSIYIYIYSKGVRVVKKPIDEYVPEDVRVKVKIEPAFRITYDIDPSVIVYGDTAIDALRRMRNALKQKTAVIDGKVRQQYGDIKVSTDDPRLVAATGWGEAKFD